MIQPDKTTPAQGVFDWQTRRQQVRQIWQAGVDAVDSESLVRSSVRVENEHLVIAEHRFALDKLGKLLVVGAGKAGAGMARGFEQALPRDLVSDRLSGWVNVPEDCISEVPLEKIHLHAARPAGINEPTAEGLRGTEEILRRVRELKPEDVCVVLISGGGSALLPAPAVGISLEDKWKVTRTLSRAGAGIEELNTVRKAISRVKGGGLARACQAAPLISLIISDIVGDPLGLIASGPTVLETPDVQAAWEILNRLIPEQIPDSIREHLQKKIEQSPADEASGLAQTNVWNHILGSNQVALSAAADEAKRLGYEVISLGSEKTGTADSLGRELIEIADHHSRFDSQDPICLLCGGETVVDLSGEDSPGKGGRNQEVATSATLALAQKASTQDLSSAKTHVAITLLAAGTDGEDGPTDAAGGFADEQTVVNAQQAGLDISKSLKQHDCYHFLQASGSLLKTGPTHTNVMDLCVVLVHRS